MNLNRAFEYKNYLSTLLNQAGRYIGGMDNRYKITQVHHLHDADPDKEDKTEQVSDSKYQFDHVVELVEFVMREYEFLCKAVNEAKRCATVDVDAAIETNKFMRLAATFLANVAAGDTPKTSISRGVAYRINAEGNQASISYEVETVYEDAFDRTKLKGISKEMRSRADAISDDIAKAMIETEVDFTPAFDVAGDFDDAMETYMKYYAVAVA